ncbi:hypothetical protein NHH03_27635 [Stieleria sp. TO1_6]|uniref:hypothetical protein n=1 Tax=Stieleria tagensis TaxID=2956795 RepID=UPI00209AB5F4|nr:hypothetical protein [Stieleria tagensis]MCO8125542.1 hypothetical protein [Stieleria tagensis]
MKTATKTALGAQVTSQLLRSLHDHLVDQDFSTEEGEVKLIDIDESTLSFGLFAIDQETGRLESDPEVIWSIEVFADVEGGR